MDYTIYNVQFVLNHAVIATAVPVEPEKNVTEEEVIESATEFLKWDGIDVSRAQDIIVEQG